ncbi:MAG: cyclic nucleotide-binding domain-containing protein [Actinomycetota bacterium]
MGDSGPSDDASTRSVATAGEWSGLAAVGSVRTFAAEAVVALEGDAADEVFVLLTGELVAERRTAHGDVQVGRVSAGEVVGEITVIAGGRRTASLRATSPCEVLVIARDVFERWLIEHPALADRVSQQARERLDRTHVAAMVTDLIGTTDPDTLEAVLSRIDWRRLAAGEVLFRQGDPADAAYFVVNGRLAVSAHDADDGTETVLAEVGRGDVVGEIGLLDDAPRSATVRATRDSTVAAFSAAAFEELVALAPPLMMHVARGVVDTLRRGPRRTVTRAHSLAVVVVADLDVDRLVSLMTDELDHFGSVRTLSSSGVDELLSRPGIAQADPANVGVPRLSEFLHEAEIGNDHLLLIADGHDGEVSNWTDRVLRQADRVLVFASASPTGAERARIAQLTPALSAIAHLTTMLAVVHPTDAARPSVVPEWRNALVFDEVVHVRDRDDDTFRRVTRLATGHGIGLVLSGGGARGFAHIGVYRALRAAGIPIDVVGGCSIGAPIAGGIAIGIPDTDMVPTAERLFHRLLDYTLPVVSLLKGERISTSIDEVFGSWLIEDMWLPFYCVSTNLTTSSLEVHRSGDAALAVRASVSIPGVLPPVPYGRSLLVDGGVLDNLPIDAMVADQRVGTVLAVDVTPSRGPRPRSDYGVSVSGPRALYSRLTKRGHRYPSVSSVLVRSMLAGAMHHQIATASSDAVDHLFKLQLSGVGLLDFERVREVVDTATRAVGDDVAELVTARPELHRTATGSVRS